MKSEVKKQTEKLNHWVETMGRWLERMIILIVWQLDDIRVRRHFRRVERQLRAREVHTQPTLLRWLATATSIACAGIGVKAASPEIMAGRDRGPGERLASSMIKINGCVRWPTWSSNRVMSRRPPASRRTPITLMSMRLNLQS